MMKTCVIVMLLAAGCVQCNVTTTCSQKEVCNSYLDMAKEMISKAQFNIPTCRNCPLIQPRKAVDCADVLEMGHNKSGIYEIFPISRMTEKKSVYVYCDMDTNGGGWTVIQRRGDFQTPKDYFYQDWQSYKEGFGNIEQDFWLGNDKIFALTNQKLYSVRFDLKDVENNTRYAVYNNFWIADEINKYALHISVYTGDAGDSMKKHNNQKFSTSDRDNDNRGNANCAQQFKGAWWYNDCYDSNLNGLYFKDKKQDTEGIVWRTWMETETLKHTEIKIRPVHFKVAF